MSVRWIAHVDMDSFYVSVERLKNPKLNGLPVVVGGKGPRSVISSASYEARKFGVRSAMPTAQARRLCPKLVIVEPDFRSYSRLSRLVFSELEKVAPMVEQVSVDEAYLDFTGCERLYSSWEESAELVRVLVKKSSGLTASVGVATNKLVAKVASDLCKPNGFLIVEPGTEEKLFAPLSIKKIPGVGTKTAIILERARILTCADLLSKTPSWLSDHVGQIAVDLRDAARGINTSEVSNDGLRKSLGAEETFDVDIGEMEKLRDVLHVMSEDIATSLRAEDLEAWTIQIKMRYADFSTWTRAKTLREATQLSREVYETACDLLEKHKQSGMSLRLLGVSVRNLSHSVEGKRRARQLSLFEDPIKRGKEEKLEAVKDELKRRFGRGILKN